MRAYVILIAKRPYIGSNAPAPRFILRCSQRGRDLHKSPEGALTARWWAHGAGLRPPVAPLLGAG